ncbi:hypothetical protein EBT25_06915 [bacterium]|nr:hypothetical protein [bacterium]
MEELIALIQSDPELWNIVEQLKHQDEEMDDFLLSVASMLSIEFDELHKTDLSEKLAALFGGLPEAAFRMAPLILHVALDLFLFRAIPNRSALGD